MVHIWSLIVIDAPKDRLGTATIFGQRLMGETKWEKGVAVFCSFLRLQTTYLADQGPNLQKSAKIFDKLPFLPFSLSHLALPKV